jgi:hypothetical protein
VSRPTSELLEECHSALRIYRFAQKVYDSIIEDIPEIVQIRTEENIWIYQQIRKTAEAEITREEAYTLCELALALQEELDGKENPEPRPHHA